MHTLLNRILPVALALLLPADPIAIAQDAEAGLPILAAIDTDGLKAKDGQKVVVYGETARSGKSQSGMNFVNFKDAEFALVTFKSDLEPFKDGEPADLYDGKRIVVTGVISIYKEKPQIKLTSPDQVRILAEGDEWPKPAPVEKAEATPASAGPSVASAPSEQATTDPKPKPPVDAKLYFK